MTSEPPHFLSGKRILVSGGGIAGLAFAIALRRQWPTQSSSSGPSTVRAEPPPALAVFERDAHTAALGREGYSQSIRSDAPGGVQALQRLGVLGAAATAAISAADGATGAGFCLWDAAMRPLLKARARPVPGLPVAGLRIARSALRRVMVDAATKAGCAIAWGRRVVGVARGSDGRLEVRMADGGVETCDLFVVADGASSKIRGLLRPEDGLVFRGVCCVGGTSRFEGSPPDPVNRDWGMVLSGTGTGLFLSPVDERSALWSVSYRCDSPRDSKRQPMTAEEEDALLAEARKHVDELPPLFEELVSRTDRSTLLKLNAQDKEPFRHTNAEFPDVIFIGDANHCVSPFAGNGASLALNDGWDLAQQLCQSSSLREAITAYDALVESRSRKVLKQSHYAIALAHARGWKAWVYVLVIRLVAWLFLRNQIDVSRPDETQLSAKQRRPGTEAAEEAAAAAQVPNRDDGSPREPGAQH